MHHYKKIVEDEDQTDEDQKDEGFSWLLIVLVVLFIIGLVIGGRVLYNSLKKEDKSYDKLRNPKSREDCFPIAGGLGNTECLKKWKLTEISNEINEMTPDKIAIAMGAVKEPVQNYKNLSSY